MANCKDCICYEILCRDTLQENELKLCESFKNKADFVEVKHSEWELKSEIHKMFDDVDEEFYVECPLCHRTEYVPFELDDKKMLEYAKEHYPYCHCGARMDGRSKG